MPRRDFVMTETWWLLSMAQSLKLEDWQRVGYLGHAKALASGHAPMAQGEVTRVLMAPDPDTGEVRKASSVNVNRAVSTAVKRGMLSHGSCARCLILPSRIVNGSLEWGVTRGTGTPQPCPVHHPAV